MPRPSHPLREITEALLKMTPSVRLVLESLRGSHPADAIPQRRTIEKWREQLRTESEADLVGQIPTWESAGLPEELVFLNRLRVMSRVLFSTTLTTQDEKWATRIRPGIEEVDPQRQLWIVIEYGRRESTAERIGMAEPYTQDLDEMIAFQPWTPKGHQAWLAAINFGIIHAPMLMWGNQEFDSDSSTHESQFGGYFLSPNTISAAHWNAQIPELIESNTKDRR